MWVCVGGSCGVREGTLEERGRGGGGWGGWGGGAAGPHAVQDKAWQLLGLEVRPWPKGGGSGMQPIAANNFLLRGRTLRKTDEVVDHGFGGIEDRALLVAAC